MTDLPSPESVVCGCLIAVASLTLAFVALKLCGVLGWSWFWVLAPAWIPVAACVAYFGVLAVLLVLALTFGHQ